MIEIIATNLADIRALCVKWGVRRLDIFGSGARGDFISGESDLDFFVQFRDHEWEGSFKRYMGFKFGLEDLLGVDVDVVEPDAVTNPYFFPVADLHRQNLYAA